MTNRASNRAPYISYRPQEKVSLPDLISVRTHLDQRDLLADEAFDTLLSRLAREPLDAGKGAGESV